MLDSEAQVAMQIQLAMNRLMSIEHRLGTMGEHEHDMDIARELGHELNNLSMKYSYFTYVRGD